MRCYNTDQWGHGTQKGASNQPAEDLVGLEYYTLAHANVCRGGQLAKGSAPTKLLYEVKFSLQANKAICTHGCLLGKLGGLIPAGTPQRAESHAGPFPPASLLVSSARSVPLLFASFTGRPGRLLSPKEPGSLFCFHSCRSYTELAGCSLRDAIFIK